MTRSKTRRRSRRWRIAFSILLAVMALYENLPAEAEFEVETRRFHPENTSESIADPEIPEIVEADLAEPDPDRAATLVQPMLDIDLAQPLPVLEQAESAIAPPALPAPPAAEMPAPNPDAVPSAEANSNPSSPDVALSVEHISPPAEDITESAVGHEDQLTQLLADRPPPDPELGTLRLEPLAGLTEPLAEATADPDLGILRLQTLRSRRDEELGILRLLEQAQAAAEPPAPTVFIGGRVGLFDSDNVFRSPVSVDEQVAQLGLALYAFPKLSERTSLYAIAESNAVRYSEFSSVDYNELQFQLGLRQRLSQRAYAQLGWRNRYLYQDGLRKELLRANYIDLLLSRRDVLNRRLWLDSYYQAFVSFVEPTSSSRFHQTLTLSLNYGFSPDLRATLLYQLNFDDYTEIERFDTYHQVMGLMNYSITPNSRLTLFGGVKFGNSTSSSVDFDDLIYGIGLNLNVPLF